MQQATLNFLEARFPGQVPAAVIERIKAETNLAKLVMWGKLAGTAKTPEQFQGDMA